MITAQLPCPTCGRLTPISAAKHLPFCSERCRLIDLGRWLDEDHAIPVAPADEDEESSLNAEAGGSEKTLNAGASSYERPRRPVRLPPGWHDA